MVFANLPTLIVEDGPPAEENQRLVSIPLDDVGPIEALAPDRARLHTRSGRTYVVPGERQNVVNALADIWRKAVAAQSLRSPLVGPVGRT